MHLTTGTHVAQICWFLLTESRHIPARLVQTGPPGPDEAVAKFDIIDLDLSRYNALQQRFDQLSREYSSQLKGGIDTRNAAYNTLIDRIELVAGNSDAPILLLGETGTGKSELAERIYNLKLDRRRVKRAAGACQLRHAEQPRCAGHPLWPAPQLYRAGRFGTQRPAARGRWRGALSR